MSKHNLRVMYRGETMFLGIKVDDALLRAIQTSSEIAIPLWDIYAAKRIYLISQEIEGLNWNKANLEKGLSEDGKPFIVQRLADEIAMKEL